MKPIDFFHDLFAAPDEESDLIYDDENLERFGNKMLAAMLLTVALIVLCVVAYLAVMLWHRLWVFGILEACNSCF